VYSDELQQRGDFCFLPKLPVIVRYMRYFLRDEVNVHYSEGKLG